MPRNAPLRKESKPLGHTRPSAPQVAPRKSVNGSGCREKPFCRGDIKIDISKKSERISQSMPCPYRRGKKSGNFSSEFWEFLWLHSLPVKLPIRETVSPSREVEGTDRFWEGGGYRAKQDHACALLILALSGPYLCKLAFKTVHELWLFSLSPGFGFSFGGEGWNII